ncbi:MAG: hypothetical protein JWQ87_5295 [Candidatus Sulfotelmatobacter sp.]|nr:hypothetical protein [Candidatus Sulfotelmatobacter sp.]
MDMTESALSNAAIPTPVSVQDARGQRRPVLWPKGAEVLLADYVERRRSTSCSPSQYEDLITVLVTLTGNPREACIRYARRAERSTNQVHRSWTRGEQQRLLDLIGLNPPAEVAKQMKRSPGAIRAMLARLGASAQMGRDWFTKFTLASALHIRVEEVQKWIERGWLKYRIVETGKLKKEIIDADDFAEFCKNYRHAIVGNRLNTDRLEFVRNFVFPPSHTELLSVRESKKERSAYKAAGRVSEPHSSAIAG